MEQKFEQEKNLILSIAQPDIVAHQNDKSNKSTMTASTEVGFKDKEADLPRGEKNLRKVRIEVNLGEESSELLSKSGGHPYRVAFSDEDSYLASAVYGISLKQKGDLIKVKIAKCAPPLLFKMFTCVWKYGNPPIIFGHSFPSLLPLF